MGVTAGGIQTSSDHASVSYKTNCCAKLKALSLTVAQLAIRTIFIVASLLVAMSLFSLQFHAIVMPVVGISSCILSSFFFLEPPQNASVESNPPPLMRPLDLPPGLQREGNNCSFNSLVHFIESNPSAAKWIRAPIPTDRNPFIAFLQNYGAPQPFIDDFFNNYQQNPALSVLDNFLQFVQTPKLNEIREIVDFRDRYQNMLVIKNALSSIFADYDQARDARVWALPSACSQKLRTAIHQVRPSIHPSSDVQEDAQESLLEILSILPSDNQLEIDKSSTYDLTGLPGIKNCPNSVVVQDELYRDLQIPVTEGDPQPNLQTMLDGFCHTVEARERRSVNETNILYPLTTSLRFKQAPPALNLQIKRMDLVAPVRTWLEVLFPSIYPPTPDRQLVKNSTPVISPDRLHITLVDGSQANYQLTGFIQHRGQTLDSGHYVAGRIINEQKFIMNDACVTPIINQQEWETCLHQAYLLCYIKI